jgi:serine/threonine-protein kinase RsbW
MSAPRPHWNPGRSTAIELTIPLRPEFAPTVRILISSLAADASFSVDEVDDLRLAVSEVFSSLVTSCGDRLCRILIDTHGPGLKVNIAATVGDLSATTIALDDLATRIITAVVDEASFDDDSVTLVKVGSVDQTSS